jgi:hypothetical protein
MPNYLDDFVCDLQCEDVYNDCLTEEDWDQIVQDSIDLDSWGNW